MTVEYVGRNCGAEGWYEKEADERHETHTRAGPMIKLKCPCGASHNVSDGDVITCKCGRKLVIDWSAEKRRVEPKK